MGKTILILHRVDFYFQNTRQSKDYIEWRVLGLWPKKLEFQKYFSKTDISLISFQQLDLNRHDLWSMRFDSRTRKIFKQEHRLSLQNPWQKWRQHFPTLLKMLTTWGQYSWTKKENKQYPYQLGIKKESDDESSKFIKVMFSIWQWQGKTFLSINRWTNLQIILGEMLFKHNPWSSAP